jgi:DNA polymerase-4
VWVLHVDLDQFVAAVEMLGRPELAGLPVVVGGAGDPTQRGVVATASYAAREHGVHSGMPLRTAVKRCPQAVFLPADNAAYEEASAAVQLVLRSFDVVVEILGWDEAFLGAITDDPESLARQVQAAVLAGTALHCSVGIGDNTLRAKLATEFAKPAGVFRLTEDNWEAVMFDRPTRALWGVGAKTAHKLADLGYATVRDLAAADVTVLADRLGPTMGPWYLQLAGALVTRVWNDVRDDGRPVARVAVKMRFAPFFTSTRSAGLQAPSADPGVIEAAALAVLERFEHGRPVRLVGVRLEFPTG